MRLLMRLGTAHYQEGIVARIRCEKGHTHTSVADVRACAGVAGVATAPRDGFRAPNSREAVKDLREQAVGVLGRLFPELPRPRLHFALTLDEVVHFFEASMPTRGRWAGALFLSEQAGDAFFRVRGWEREASVLTTLLKNPLAAVELYGQKLGTCGVCHRTLTDEESRARGIGPVCLRKNGVV
jgi:hypothetical protein